MRIVPQLDVGRALGSRVRVRGHRDLLGAVSRSSLSCAAHDRVIALRPFRADAISAAIALAAVLIPLALTAHPTGIVAIAPVVAIAPECFRWARARPAVAVTVLTASGALALALAFVGSDVGQSARRADAGDVQHDHRRLARRARPVLRPDGSRGGLRRVRRRYDVRGSPAPPRVPGVSPAE